MQTAAGGVPFNGEEDDEPDGDEAERVGGEEKALADSGRVEPADAVMAGPQRQPLLEPDEQDVRQQHETIGQRDRRQIDNNNNNNNNNNNSL